MPEPPIPSRTRVLVIGGGPVGLVVSGLLSQHGIGNVVLEKRSGTQRAPAAHVIRRRPMEILEGLGVGDEVRRAASPLALDFIVWCATLGGVELGRLDLRRHPETGEKLPDVWTNCSQNRLEPILLRHAESRNEARIAPGAECVDISQTRDAVTARVRTEDGVERDIEADWAIAADGAGSPTRRALGIAMEGLGPLARFFMVHFEADLTPWIEKRPGPLYWIMNPESPGTIIVHDPTCSHVFMMPRRGEENEEDTVPRRLAAALDIPLTPKIVAVDTWSPHVQVASRYREGRVLLVGDAAHRFPPTGGLGLNTGIQEARVLVEKLVEVVTRGAPEPRLDAYESECRPAAQRNADDSFENLKRLGEISRVVGDCPDRVSLERRLDALTDSEREQLAGAIEAQRSHFASDGVQPGATSLPLPE